jgi:putative peptidoglycan lipid II flippase
MGRAALVVSAGVLLSRILGMAREILLADVIGATGAGDAYRVAFIIPDFLNYLLAGGYMAITFIPILSRYFVADDEEGAWRALVAVARPVAIAMTVLAAIGMAAARPIIEALTELSPAGVDEAVRLTRIVLPAQVFFVLGTLLMAVQYARERFLVPSLAPIIYNAGIILGGLLLTSRLGESADGFAWGALAGAIVGNFALQAWGAGMAGLRLPRGVPAQDPVLREYLLLAVPLMVGQSLVLLDESLGRIFGTQLGEGPASQLAFARQTMLVPIGIIAHAAGVATYPYLSRLFEEGRLTDLNHTLWKAIRYVIALSLLAAAALAALSLPTIRVLFERGRFEAADTLASSGALVFYALGIPAWGVQQLLARGFYARRQMWVPVVTGTIATVVAVPLYIALKEPLGVEGLALASTLAVTTYTIALALVWVRRTGTGPSLAVLKGTARSLIPAVVAGLAGWGVGTAIGFDDFSQSLLALVAGSLTVAAAFLGVAALLGDYWPSVDTRSSKSEG